MMDYGVFKKVIVTRIKEYLPPVYAKFEVNVEQVPKINGVKEAMIVEFNSDGCRMAGPNIYLDDLYMSFMQHEDLDMLLKDTACKITAFTGTQNLGQNETVDMLQYRSDIIKVLVNTEMNKDLLKAAPHKDFLDLSVTYRIAVNESGGNGYATALITNELLDELKMTPEELDTLAEENSRRKLKTQVIAIGPKARMMITTGMAFGGINLQRTDEIRKIADELDSDLYLLPSSIHDVMVFAESVCDDENKFFEMLKSGNDECNDAGENLSYNIYYYDRTENKLEIRYSNITAR